MKKHLAIGALSLTLATAMGAAISGALSSGTPAALDTGASSGGCGRCSGCGLKDKQAPEPGAEDAR